MGDPEIARRLFCAIISLAGLGVGVWACSRKSPQLYWPLIASGLFMAFVFGMGAGVR